MQAKNSAGSDKNFLEKIGKNLKLSVRAYLKGYMVSEQ